MSVTRDHFLRAAVDVGTHGDNDTLPFDVDVRFIKEKQAEVADMAFAIFNGINAQPKEDARRTVNSLEVFFERLLVPTGSAGFRITTKIHPFWNVYLNGLGIAIAEALEPTRSPRAHSYRYRAEGDRIFEKATSWRAFREACIADTIAAGEECVVVQTDVSSFYEHINHHRVENLIADHFKAPSTVATQVDRFLSKVASGRSFGLPVGGQCARVLAELLMSNIDRMLTDAGITWRRYVDDFVMVTISKENAYAALATLSHVLADYGLTLNRTKSTMMSGRHFVDYVKSQLGDDGEEAQKLRKIDLSFDPYSETSEEDYAELRDTVESLDVATLLHSELSKSQPDTFLVTQIGRTVKLHKPKVALQLCETLLAPGNLHAFRASWATIMRGVSAVRGDDQFAEIFVRIDVLLDQIPAAARHLLQAEASVLHYLRTLRFTKTEARGQYVLALFNTSQSRTVRRACIDCWRGWRDRPTFMTIRNKWGALSAEEQRMLWLMSREFGDEGANFRGQERRSAARSWALGLDVPAPDFQALYFDWCNQ